MRRYFFSSTVKIKENECFQYDFKIFVLILQNCVIKFHNTEKLCGFHLKKHKLIKLILQSKIYCIAT